MIKNVCCGLIFLTLLSGCASMSDSECRVADWGRVGFNDGANGESEKRMADYSEDCAKIGITVQPQAYRQGWDTGIQRFCTATNGWREGIQGRRGKSAVCQGQPGFDVFNRYLEAGLQVHRTAEQVRRNDQESNQLQKRLEGAGSDDDKKRWRESLRALDRQQFFLRNLLRQQQILSP